MAGHWQRGYDDAMAGRPMPERALYEYFDGYDAAKRSCQEIPRHQKGKSYSTAKWEVAWIDIPSKSGGPLL